jgi:hypothetical protein
MSDSPNTDVFRQEIQQIINVARSKGEKYIDILSSDVHRRVGGYPSQNHRMATCCEVMYSMMKSVDKVIYAPPKGKGANLKIRYHI